jgi:hypothetical protein
MKVLADLMSSEDLIFWFTDGIFSLCLHMAEDTIALSGSFFIMALIPSMKAPLDDLITSQRPYFLIPSLLGLRFHCMNFRGT